MKKKLAITALVLLTLLLVAGIAVMANPLLLMLPFALTGNYSGVRSNAPLAPLRHQEPPSPEARPKAHAAESIPGLQAVFTLALP